MTAHTEEVDQGMTKALNRIPLAFWGFAFTVLLNLVVLVTFINKIDARTTNNELQIGIEKQERVDADRNQVAAIDSIRTGNVSANISLATIKERQEGQNESIKDIKDLLKDIQSRMGQNGRSIH